MSIFICMSYWNWQEIATNVTVQWWYICQQSTVNECLKRKKELKVNNETLIWSSLLSLPRPGTIIAFLVVLSLWSTTTWRRPPEQCLIWTPNFGTLFWTHKTRIFGYVSGYLDERQYKTPFFWSLDSPESNNFWNWPSLSAADYFAGVAILRDSMIAFLKNTLHLHIRWCKIDFYKKTAEFWFQCWQRQQSLIVWKPLLSVNLSALKSWHVRKSNPDMSENDIIGFWLPPHIRGHRNASDQGKVKCL